MSQIRKDALKFLKELAEKYPHPENAQFKISKSESAKNFFNAKVLCSECHLWQIGVPEEFDDDIIITYEISVHGYLEVEPVEEME